MKRYDPNNPPDPDEWLAIDEALRIDMVSSFHRRAGFRLPSLRSHSTIHVIIENQLAAAEPVVVGLSSGSNVMDSIGTTLFTRSAQSWRRISTS